MFVFTRIKFLPIYLLSVSLMATSCGGNENAEDKTETEDTISASDKTLKKAQKVLFSLPSPIEMAELIRSSGANYNKDLLNPIDNTSKYSTNAKRALNLGIYGADLAYTTIFNQTQESVFYLAACKKMADGLGITSAFSESTIQRMQENMSNQDSMLNIVSESYYTTDAFLKENDRASTSALVISAGWLEGLHIATSIAMGAKKNEGLMTRIAEERFPLNNMIGLMESYPDDENVKEILKGLQELKAIYDKIETKAGETEVKTDEKAQITTIGGGAETANISPEQLKAISEKVESIRTTIIN